MLSRFFDRWTKSKALTTSELAVLRLLLPCGNKYAEKLYSQAINAPFIERQLVDRSHYEAIIPYVVDDSMLIECDENRESPLISIPTLQGTPLGFTTTILRGGFLRGLKGHTLTGEDWQKVWTPVLESARVPSGMDTWIPEPLHWDTFRRTLEELLAWAGVNGQRLTPGNCELVRLAAPVTAEQILACESRLQIRLGEQYRELLLISNGFGIHRGRPYECLGSSDIDFVESDRDWLCLTPLYEEGCVAIRCNDGVVSNECFLITSAGNQTPLGDIKQHVRDSLTWAVAEK